MWESIAHSQNWNDVSSCAVIGRLATRAEILQLSTPLGRMTLTGLDHARGAKCCIPYHQQEGTTASWGVQQGQTPLTNDCISLGRRAESAGHRAHSARLSSIV